MFPFMGQKWANSAKKSSLLASLIQQTAKSWVNYGRMLDTKLKLPIDMLDIRYVNYMILRSVN